MRLFWGAKFINDCLDVGDNSVPFAKVANGTRSRWQHGEKWS